MIQQFFSWACLPKLLRRLACTPKHSYRWACPARRGSGCPLQVLAPRTSFAAAGFPLPSLTLALCFIQSFVFAQAELSFTDKIYEPQIKTVWLYPNEGGTQDYLQPSATSIGKQTLMLEFDDLQDNRNNYYAKLIHCNYDWTKSRLMDLDFLQNYNEYSLNDYSFSNTTYSHYVHYRFEVPPVKITGNYLLVVYRDDISNLILSKRMMVFDNQIDITQNNQFMGLTNINRASQQFNFILDYGDDQLINPTDNVHVNMRQNQRWDNAKTDLCPTYVRENDKQIDYQFLDDSWTFNGGNEFRFADFRSLTHPGQNTGRIIKTTKPNELYLAIDKPRGDEAYSQYNDLDGNYIVDNTDYGEANVTGSYLYIDFTLKTETPYNGDVYVVGKFNDYQRTDDNKMKYNEATSSYQCQQYVKQGRYDYQYILQSKTESPDAIEGSHYETENVYEVAIYYRPFTPNADLLIGYYLIPVNPR